MRTNRADPPKKLLQVNNKNISVDNHKLSRRLTREISVNKGLIEDYYHEEVPVSVPFKWESEPGTPKIRFRDSLLLPPLTPPPSYLCNTPKCPIRKIPNPKSNNLFNTLFTKRATKEKNNTPSSPFSSSSSSASSSSSSSSRSSSSSVQSSSSPRLWYDYRPLYEEEDEYESHDDNVSSALCFPRVADARPRGWYSSLIKIFLKN